MTEFESDTRGEAATFATVLVWDEAAFDYQRIVYCTRDADARDEYLAMHAPPLVIVVNVRRDRDPPRYPASR